MRAGKSAADGRVVRAAGGGLTFTGALLLLFIGLKLGGKIDWSWWWVFAPLWGPIAAVAAVVAGHVAVTLVVEWPSLRSRRRRRW